MKTELYEGVVEGLRVFEYWTINREDNVQYREEGSNKRLFAVQATCFKKRCGRGAMVKSMAQSNLVRYV